MVAALTVCSLNVLPNHSSQRGRVYIVTLLGYGVASEGAGTRAETEIEVEALLAGLLYENGEAWN